MKVSPQLEDGHTRIANELLEALIAARVSGEELRIVWAVIRKTYGFNKKVDRISWGQFERMTGIPKKRCQRVMRKLVEKNMVVKSGSFWKPTYGPQKNYSKWRMDSIPQEGDIPPQGDRVSPRRGIEVSPRRGTTKDSKDTRQKKGEEESVQEGYESKYSSVLTILHSIQGWPADPKKDDSLIQRNKDTHNLIIDQLEQAAIGLATWYEDRPGEIEKSKANPRSRFNTFCRNRAKWDRESGLSGGVGGDGQSRRTITVGHIRQDLTSYLMRAASGQMNFEQFKAAILGRYEGQTVNPETVQEAWGLAHREFGAGDGA